MMDTWSYSTDDVGEELSGALKVLDGGGSMRCCQLPGRWDVGGIDGRMAWASWFRCWSYLKVEGQLIHSPFKFASLIAT